MRLLGLGLQMFILSKILNTLQACDIQSTVPPASRCFRWEFTTDGATGKPDKNLRWLSQESASASSFCDPLIILCSDISMQLGRNIGSWVGKLPAYFCTILTSVLLPPQHYTPTPYWLALPLAAPHCNCQNNWEQLFDYNMVTFSFLGHFKFRKPSRLHIPMSLM